MLCCVLRVAIKTTQIKVGTVVFALKNHATYLAKELLIACGKGTDASNCHDEEADEEEFSDDEQASNHIQNMRLHALFVRSLSYLEFL